MAKKTGFLAHLLHRNPYVEGNWEVWIEGQGNAYRSDRCKPDKLWPTEPRIAYACHTLDIGMGWAAMTDNVRMLVTATSKEEAVEIVQAIGEELWRKAPEAEVVYGN